MQNDEIKSQTIDGQEMFFLNENQWEKVKSDKVINNKSVNPILINFYNDHSEYYKKYSELSLGVTRIFERWFPIEMLKINQTFQRVFLERLTCPHCNWSGMTANPLVSDLYLGFSKDKEKELLEIANSYPVIPCPVCNEKLPRHPIWVEHNDNVPN